MTPKKVLSPGRFRPWIRKNAAGRKKSKGGISLPDIPARLAAAQADSVCRLFDNGTGRWKEVLLHFLSRASRGAPYGKELLLSSIPEEAILKALPGPYLQLWREAISNFKRLPWARADPPPSPAARLIFSDTHIPGPKVQNPRAWERTFGIVRAADTFNPALQRFKTFQEVLQDYISQSSAPLNLTIPGAFRTRSHFAQMNGENPREPKAAALARATREWDAITHCSNYPLPIGRKPTSAPSYAHVRQSTATRPGCTTNFQLHSSTR